MKSMIAMLQAFRVCSAKALLVAGLVAGTSMISGTANAAIIDLSTGAGLALGGVVDPNWKVTSTALTDQRLQTVTDTTGFPFVNPGTPTATWVADNAGDQSHWLVPTAYGQVGAPGSTVFTYSRNFNLTFDEAREGILAGRWLSDNNTTSITLNGNNVEPRVNTETNPFSFSQWTNLTPNQPNFLREGSNELIFTVQNASGNFTGNPTGFRFEGGVVPEPASLIMSGMSVLILGGFSWKRRLARHAV